ncbi:MAG: hypothetical protein KTR31_38990 [Myxococcales bacterium]|nr:hypothetical protein [Myxococcales bacterium]
MWRWVVILAAVGCGGGTDDTDTDTNTDAPTSEVDLCADVRTYDVDGLGCNQMRSAYDGVLEGAAPCVTDDDCQVLNSGCEVLMINACYRAANTCIDQSDLQPVIQAWGNCLGMDKSACPKSCGTPRAFCEYGVCQVTEREE